MKELYINDINFVELLGIDGVGIKTNTGVS